MEYKYEESWKKWCEEDEDKDDVGGGGVGCLYECVFCKRGFNTAQALGGHMNIHRRHRRFGSNVNNLSSTEQQQNHDVVPRMFHHHTHTPASTVDQPLHHHDLVCHDDHQPGSSLSAYFPASSSASTTVIRPSYRRYFPDQQHCNDDGDDDQKQPENDLVVPDHCPELEEKRQMIVSQEQELDLELRLGYHS
ncbi:putative transcriptional regulator RABBIT EARS [Sesamum alatum]|uniref:Transcriptional regulator RABBIT EARS n=1 Tax=Sesamum alatum TaxID=300844 RepID=A0AAE2D0L6_9LAMI|nr:putative transcriptional regulator RABBIT EARS [Sesamum alatum]